VLVSAGFSLSELADRLVRLHMAWSRDG
jgi:hypothetical protein